MKKGIGIFVVLIALLMMATSGAIAKDNTRVFTNITTNDVNKAAMAIKFTHAIMKNKGMEATLFFNTYGVELVNKKKRSPIYASGETIAQMIEQFIAEGGRVIACPMCMKNVGKMVKADLLPGVQAKRGAGVNAATKPNSLVLSY